MDHAFASWLATELRAAGVPTWFSVTHLKGGQQWQDAIGRALCRCDWFAVVLSPAAVKSMWVERELHYALREPRYRNRIIPVL
ncbi:MAG TPA: toll/interleukin-1 receptor domain-containing protein, partial [Verrucomicrobiota bacterium]|nr:toll/interleukin-1 receptor domain-containing protein [Verrucomicrobiota bacterium]